MLLRVLDDLAKEVYQSCSQGLPDARAVQSDLGDDF